MNRFHSSADLIILNKKMQETAILLHGIKVGQTLLLVCLTSIIEITA